MMPVYREKDTLVHGLHPLTALLLVATLAALALLGEDPVSAALACGGTLALLRLGGNWEDCRPFLRLGLYAALLMTAINPLVNHQGSHVLVYGPRLPWWGALDITLEALVYGPRLPWWGALDITLEALLYGLFAGMRLFTVIAACGLLSTAVSPDELLDLLSRLALRSSLAAALAVRLYPGMVNDAARMREVQMVRGERLEVGSPRQRLKAHLPLWMSLFQGSLDRAACIAEAMSARGFGSGRRTAWKRRRFQPRDALVALCCALLAGCAAASPARRGYSFFPTLAPPFTRWGVLWPFLPVLALLSLLSLSWSWRRWHWLRSRI